MTGLSKWWIGCACGAILGMCLVQTESPSRQSDDATARELKKLQGDWTIVSETFLGNTQTGHQGKFYLTYGGASTFFRIRGNKLWVETEKWGLIWFADLRPDPTQNPKSLWAECIYQLKGDTLTLCLGSPRPTAFVATNKDTNQVLILKKKKAQ